MSNKTQIKHENSMIFSSLKKSQMLILSFNLWDWRERNHTFSLSQILSPSHRFLTFFYILSSTFPNFCLREAYEPSFR